MLLTESLKIISTKFYFLHNQNVIQIEIVYHNIFYYF